MGIQARVIELTGGNVRNFHIYLRGHLDFFPTDAIGGANKSKASIRPLHVEWAPEKVVDSDIDGDKQILRGRSWVRQFFIHNAVREGDLVVIEKTGERHYRVHAVQRSRYLQPSDDKGASNSCEDS